MILITTLLKPLRKKWHVFDVLIFKIDSTTKTISVNNDVNILLKYKMLDQKTILITQIEPSYFKYIMLALIDKSINPLIVANHNILLSLKLLNFRQKQCDNNMKDIYECGKIWTYDY